MLFTELRFLVFFALAFGVHWGLPSGRARKTWLLLCSYGFYAAWDWRFLSLIVASTVVDYVVGGRLARTDEVGRRRGLLGLSLVANLGILGFFKYYNFFAESGAALSAWLGLPVSPRVLEIVLPVGISFYTFQTLSYTIDIYRRRLGPTDSWLDFAVFVGFFPQLVAGPIVRASDFLPQLSASRRLADVDFRAALTLFLAGYVKKACIADQVAQAVDPVFASPQLYDAASLWLASVLYTLQIYCDFSGYSDMAIACAALLGFRLLDNFDFPYLAPSYREYWRRWHISLSSWFRDYLYIPLGGNRATPARVAMNLCIVFLLCGLWHGAAWTFVVWGVYHGVFLSVERFLPVERLPRAVAHLYLLLGVNAGFVIFRAQDLATAGRYLTGMLGLGAQPASASANPMWWALVASFALVHVWLARRPIQQRVAGVPPWAFAVGYGLAVAAALPWAAAGYQPFIYFQF